MLCRAVVIALESYRLFYTEQSEHSRLAAPRENEEIGRVVFETAICSPRLRYLYLLGIAVSFVGRRGILQ